MLPRRTRGGSATTKIKSAKPAIFFTLEVKKIDFRLKACFCLFLIDTPLVFGNLCQI